MARFKRDRPGARDRVIQVRVTAAEADYLKAEAVRRSLNVSDLLREALDAYLTKKKGAR